MQPVETEFGRKRQIDQSACNKDFSCLKGFCPSFVTVEGGELRQGHAAAAQSASCALSGAAGAGAASLDRPWNILVTGIGGTGVVTIGHLLGMAAHLEGKGAALIDMVGLSQKNGAVVDHIRIAGRPEDIARGPAWPAARPISSSAATWWSPEPKVLAAVKRGTTAMVINLAETLSGEFTRNPEFSLPTERIKRTITALAGARRTISSTPTAIATALLGESIGANLFMLGYA